MNQDYLLRIIASLGLLLIGVFNATSYGNPGVTGFCLAFSYLVFRSAEKLSNLKGKTEPVKILNIFTPNLIEFTGLTLTAFFSPHLVLSAVTVGLIGFTECFRSQLDRKISRSGFNFLERGERVLILSLVFLLSFLNVYWMFYGLILVSGLALVDLSYSLYQMTKA